MDTYGGTLSMHVENDPSLQGASDRDLNSGAPVEWQLSHTVVRQHGQPKRPPSPAATQMLGSHAVKYHGSSDAGGGTTATLLDGTLSAESTIAIGEWHIGPTDEGGSFAFSS